MGWAQPYFMPASMSATVAWPVSASAMADSRYGTSRRFTTNPARSSQRMTCLPSTSVVKAARAATTCSSLATERTISTSGCTGAGLKKCMPTTRCGRPVAVARSTMAMEEVLEARTACGGGHLVEQPEEAALLVEVLDDGLDDEIPVGHVGHVVGIGQPALGGVVVLGADAVAGQGLAE